MACLRLAGIGRHAVVATPECVTSCVADAVRRYARPVPFRAALARLRLRYLDCGRKDEYALDVGARVFTKRCRDLGLEVRHEEFDDDHRNVSYRYEVSLPALAAVLDAD